MPKSIKWLWVFAVTLTMLCGCRFSRRTFHRQRGGSRPEITIHLEQSDTEPLPNDVKIVRRQWSSSRSWDNKDISSGLSLSLNIDNKRHFSTYIPNTAQDRIELRLTPSSINDESLALLFENALGIVRISGEFEASTDLSDFKAPLSGTVVAQIHRNQVTTLEKAFNEKLSLVTLLPLICRNISPDKMITYAECDVTINLEQARQLADHNFDASHINQLVAKGYAFTAEDFVDLARHHVSYSYIVEWKEYDDTLTADRLIYAKQHYLDADMAGKWRDIGYDLTLEKVYWVKSRYLKTAAALEWKQAGYTLDLDQLYWIKSRYLKASSAVEWEKAGYRLNLEELYYAKSRYLDPAEAGSWKQAGYDLDLEQLYWAKSRYVSAKQAEQWKNAGYQLDLKQLYKVKQYHIDPDYARAFADPAYEQLTVEELIDFKNSRISPETVKKLRRQKK